MTSVHQRQSGCLKGVEMVAFEAEVEAWDGRDPADLLRLERLDRDLFRSRLHQVNPNHSLFGGQVLAQALTAACQTVSAEAGRQVNSLHGYFLRAGHALQPVIFQVERTRDGRNFSTRRVIAVQEGEPIFHMQTSFHVEEEGFEHQLDAPDVAPPDQLMTTEQMVAYFGDRAPEWMVKRWRKRRMLDVRAVEPEQLLGGEGKPPVRRVWTRLTPGHGTAASQMEQACLLAYMSDYWLASTGAIPHVVAAPGPHLFMASLDHAMWFHRPADVRDWLLFDCDSPSTQGGRTLGRATVYDRAGRLVASVAQEALLRKPRQ